MRVRALGLAGFGARWRPSALVPGQNPDSDGPVRSRRDTDRPTPRLLDPRPAPTGSRVQSRAAGRSFDAGPPIDGGSAADLDRAFTDVLGQHPDALLVLPLHTKLSDLRRIADFAVKNRLPTSAVEARYTEAGLLMAYFPEARDRFRRLGVYIDKILRGAWPADLPVEQPAKYQLMINLKTAKALGLTIPPSILARADEIIK